MKRIVSIQHGDYRESMRIIRSGQVESYFGMSYTIDIFDKFFDGTPHMVISLDAPPYREQQGTATLVGLPRPRLPGRTPARVAEYLRAWQIRRLLRSFRPTHVLLRSALPIVALDVLRYCRRARCSTLVVLANVMSCDASSAAQNRPLIQLMNQRFVYRVGNHRTPATQSLIECGLDPAKALAWDWPAQRLAADYPIKQLSGPPFRLLYVGSLDFTKGVDTLIAAVQTLHEAGLDLCVTIIGSGHHGDDLRTLARGLPEGVVQFVGRLPNAEVFQLMLTATLVVVPSKHEFPEGMPLTLTEGLASRTPIIASDHPVIARAFVEGEGVRFFPASNSAALAELIRSTLADPAAYRVLSMTTANALDRVNCPTTFGDLIEQWMQQPPLSLGVAQG